MSVVSPSFSPEPPDVRFYEDEVREGFYISSMMKRYWAGQLKVLSEVDKICKKHNIPWYADCGTLLGAVRHGGFVPWDDDLDICMLRHDWIHFFEIAAGELPEGFRVLTLHTEKEYKDMLGRIVNSNQIDYRSEHMKDYHGCPYTVGIDIFPLDGLALENETEEKRRGRALKAEKAFKLIDEGKGDTSECRNLLDDIERENHITLHRKGDIFRELRLLMEKLYMMYPSDTAKDVALMPFWVPKKNHRYSKDLFKDTLMLPFEYTYLPVPARYEEVLKIEYGDYMAIRKGGGVHEYPVYRGQENMLKGAMGKNPFRYTLTKDAIKSLNRPRPFFDECVDMAETLLQAHKQINDVFAEDDASLGIQLLGDCQSSAISLGTMLEERLDGCENTVRILEEYCELLYKFSASWTGGCEENLDEKIISVKDDLIELDRIQKKEVLFLPCKAEWWESMAPIYKAFLDQPNANVYVMPVSYLDGDKLTGKNGGEHNDAEFFPNDMRIVTVDDYDIAKHHPDVIVIQYPYDGNCMTMDVPGFFYSNNLVKHTEKLIYVPCFDMDGPKGEDDKANAAIRVMIEQPAVLYADKVILSSQSLKDLYVKVLTEMVGEEDYWESKLTVLEPVAITEQKSLTAPIWPPEKWKEKILSKKAMVIRVNAAFLMENEHKGVEKLKSAMEIITEASDSLICVYSPDWDVAEIQSIKPELWDEYIEFIDSIKKIDMVIYDEEHLADSYPEEFSGYYGTTGNLAHKCRNSMIPVMIMSILS